MGAFNWIELEDVCPHCDEVSKIRVQTHMVSDYAGDEKGRFHDSTYKIGEKMRWWTNDDPSYKDWKDENAIDNLLNNEDTGIECCYADCLRCAAELYLIIRFVACVPTKVLKIGEERDWPESYLR